MDVYFHGMIAYEWYFLLSVLLYLVGSYLNGVLRLGNVLAMDSNHECYWHPGLVPDSREVEIAEITAWMSPAGDIQGRFVGTGGIEPPTPTVSR